LCGINLSKNEYLFNGIEENFTIIELNLSGCQLDEKKFSLYKCLMNNTSIEILNLSDNQFADYSIFRGICGNRFLKQLDFSSKKL